MKTTPCAAIGCTVQVTQSMLMCREHWFQVPKNLRDEVWAAYRTKDKARHFTAIKAAIGSLRKKESAKETP